MSDEKNDRNSEADTRRKFLKTVGATAVVAGLAVPQTAAAAAADETDLHICRGLNTCAKKGKNKSGTMPGDGDCATVAPHGCEGGNDCKNQGACGSGDYATQYWVAANACGQSGTPPKNDWDGTGGCGSPIGNGNTGFICYQLNSAAPVKDPTSTTGEFYYAGYFGKSVWEIARVRFEDKMIKAKKKFGAPSPTCDGFGGNTWTGPPATAPTPPDGMVAYGKPAPPQPQPKKSK